MVVVQLHFVLNQAVAAKIRMQNHVVQLVKNHLVQKKIRKKVSMFRYVFLALFSFLLSYNVGDVVSISDQNVVKETCYSGNGYEVGDSWSLSDWNGDLNGGNYNVIFIDMSTTW